MAVLPSRFACLGLCDNSCVCVVVGEMAGRVAGEDGPDRVPHQEQVLTCRERGD